LSGTPERDTIALIFTEVQRNKMKSASNLKDVIEIINEIDFNNSEDSHILSQFYEDILVKLGKESGIAGEFYTPRPVIRMMVKIVNPTFNLKGERTIRILDPFSGSCGFLVESYKKLTENKKLTAKEYQELQRKVFHGYEKKSLPFLVGMMNCILHGLLTPNVIRKNSLNENILNFGIDDKFDYVLTNPPFGGTESKQIQQNFPIKAQATELLALQQVMKRLKPNGKCGIVVPDGLLSRSDLFAKVREELIKNFNVHTIVSLPPGVFANVTSSGQGPKTSLVFFDKNGQTKKIWYYELIPPNGKNYTKIKPIKDSDLLECFEKLRHKEVSTNSWFVDVDEIVDNDCDLTAKNPNKKDTVQYRSPNELISSVLEKEKQIQRILEDIQNSLVI
jgi:type I restriction enzyme M protein